MGVAFHAAGKNVVLGERLAAIKAKIPKRPAIAAIKSYT
jgi:hypothetical protein